MVALGDLFFDVLEIFLSISLVERTNVCWGWAGYVVVYVTIVTVGRVSVIQSGFHPRFGGQ